MKIIIAKDNGEVFGEIPDDEIGDLDHHSGIAKAVFQADVLEMSKACRKAEILWCRMCGTKNKHAGMDEDYSVCNECSVQIDDMLGTSTHAEEEFVDELMKRTTPLMPDLL